MCVSQLSLPELSTEVYARLAAAVNVSRSFITHLVLVGDEARGVPSLALHGPHRGRLGT
jgi:hypothetical protein